VWWVMKFRDVLDSDQLLLVACHDCGGKTPLDPAPLALRLGVHTDIADVAHEMLCPVCGSADFTLGVHSPVPARKSEPALAK
jgi:Zn finger protein HypA/HybF involved in hydrogenase expression